MATKKTKVKNPEYAIAKAVSLKAFTAYKSGQKKLMAAQQKNAALLREHNALISRMESAVAIGDEAFTKSQDLASEWESAKTLVKETPEYIEEY
jgi:hypothetical protein